MPFKLDSAVLVRATLMPAAVQACTCARFMHVPPSFADDGQDVLRHTRSAACKARV